MFFLLVFALHFPVGRLLNSSEILVLSGEFIYRVIKGRRTITACVGNMINTKSNSVPLNYNHKILIQAGPRNFYYDTVF